MCGSYSRARFFGESDGGRRNSGTILCAGDFARGRFGGCGVGMQQVGRRGYAPRMSSGAAERSCEVSPVLSLSTPDDDFGTDVLSLRNFGAKA